MCDVVILLQMFHAVVEQDRDVKNFRRSRPKQNTKLIHRHWLHNIKHNLDVCFIANFHSVFKSKVKTDANASQCRLLFSSGSCEVWHTKDNVQNTGIPFGRLRMLTVRCCSGSAQLRCQFVCDVRRSTKSLLYMRTRTTYTRHTVNLCGHTHTHTHTHERTGLKQCTASQARGVITFVFLVDWNSPMSDDVGLVRKSHGLRLGCSVCVAHIWRFSSDRRSGIARFDL